MGTKLEFITDDGFDEVNIFIHGYNSDKNIVREQVLNLKLTGAVFILFWASTSESLAEKTFEMITKVALKYGSDRLVDYSIKKIRAINLGKNINEIFEIQRGFLKLLPLNLYGFSLGSLVIQSALMHNQFDKYKLKNVFLLGGVATTDYEKWKYCVGKINGKIYNVYSKQDDVLRIGALGSTVGRNPILNGMGNNIPRIKNIEVNYGHLEYMPKLYELFRECFPRRKKYKKTDSNSEFRIDATIKNNRTICPHCQSEIRIKESRKNSILNCSVCQCEYILVNN